MICAGSISFASLLAWQREAGKVPSSPSRTIRVFNGQEKLESFQGARGRVSVAFCEEIEHGSMIGWIFSPQALSSLSLQSYQCCLSHAPQSNIWTAEHAPFAHYRYTEYTLSYHRMHHVLSLDCGARPLFRSPRVGIRSFLPAVTFSPQRCTQAVAFLSVCLECLP